VPLSEEELRLLEQMERALVAEDPKLASTLRGTTLRATARRRALLAGIAFVLGIVVLMTGAVMHQTVVAIVGFVIMLGSACIALTSWRGQNHVVEKPSSAQAGSAPNFSVIEGGRTKKRGMRAPRRRSQSQGTMMQRFEERWRRRRDQNGY
jgi:Protein of unknown function (DUF3040)